MTTTDHRSSDVQRQTHQHAEGAREQMAGRRADQDGGISGWVAQRASEWDLSGPDEQTMQRQKYVWNALVDYWFRMEMDGWENLPQPPALLVGIHSGAPFVWDAWTVGVQWWRRFGSDRPLHGTAHDALMAIPLIGRYFRAMGVLPAAPDSIATALAEGRDVALWPGGEIDSRRPTIADAAPGQAFPAQGLSARDLAALGNRPRRTAPISVAGQDPDAADAGGRTRPRSQPRQRR